MADLLLAATAEVEGLTIWHYDADFDVIAAVPGQAAAWIVPRGTNIRCTSLALASAWYGVVTGSRCSMSFWRVSR
ncbi:hypothetical protein BH23ACT1_BH23ACT1_13600 [soil metagenome]